MSKKSEQEKPIILRVAKGFVRFLDFFQSIGPMLIGLVVGAVLGLMAALFLGFPIIASMLVGAAAGFVLVIFVQAMFIGGSW